MNQIGFCEWAFLHPSPSIVKFAAEVGANCLQVDDLGSRERFYPLNDKRLQQEYLELSAQYNIQLIASGGVSSLEDVKALNAMDLHGAIIGKAYYTGAIDLKTAVAVGEGTK